MFDRSDPATHYEWLPLNQSIQIYHSFRNDSMGQPSSSWAKVCFGDGLPAVLEESRRWLLVSALQLANLRPQVPEWQNTCQRMQDFGRGCSEGLFL